jgi:hypothetical protein
MNSPSSDRSARQSLLEALRENPEFTVFAAIPATATDDAAAFTSTSSGAAIGRAGWSSQTATAFYLRWSLETACLLRAAVPEPLASLAAARAASQYIAADFDIISDAQAATLPPWLGKMAADIAPADDIFANIHPAITKAQLRILRAAWPHLGSAETLMETGGDIRLQRDPRSALNGYGCSHRPRPWAITFASSTASSSSERGYAAADEARLRATAALLTGDTRPAIAARCQEIRDGLAEIYGLPAGAAVILAASGTDTELLALAITHLAAPQTPVKNILIAPAETGRGVPAAARGVHFAINTALGEDVTQEASIAGFRADTAVNNILLRRAQGGLRPIAEVEAEITAEINAGLAAGRKILLHGLDLSKTGLLAPSLPFLKTLRATHGNAIDIVIDACQARLSPASIRAYLALGAVVLVTGSKFFTGPPFAGAALLPPAIAARLQAGALPAGLDAYFGRDEFSANCPAAARLPATGNYGLSLRWHAALAEMRAFFAVPPDRREKILAAFAATVERKIAENPALSLLRRPEPNRAATDEPWERLRSIFTFTLQAPHEPRRYLTPGEARAVYLWLNADISAFIPGAPAAAARICHIGQPVNLPQAGAEGQQGVLRVSAGARLISGEPSHHGIPESERIAHELTDLETVFEKIALILANFPRLWAANPAPTYRPAARLPAAKVEA